MHYAIITNPVAGKLTPDQKRSALAKPAQILKADIHGLDTTSALEFQQCAKEIIQHCDVLVVAGGDGTISDIINAVDTNQTPLAFLPFGTGNAIQYVLKYRGSLSAIARRIQNGVIHEYDLINCDEKKRAFMVSVGIESTILKIREEYLSQGYTGLKTYFKSGIQAYRDEYRWINAKMIIDDDMVELKDVLSIMIVKQPYYGFRMKVVPKARFDDRQLHILTINSGVWNASFGTVTSFTIGNQAGKYRTGKQVDLRLDHPHMLQIDGNEAWEAAQFKFAVLPKALKIKF